MIALSSFCLSLPSPFSYIILTAFFTYYSTRLWSYRESYSNEYWMIEHNVLEQKDCHYAWVARGINKFFIADFDGALRDFGEARLQNNKDFKQNFNMAIMFLALGDIPHCEEYLKHAEETLYEGNEQQQWDEFVGYTWGLIEKAKKDGKLEISSLRIIK
jgi:hypothetical protein